ncbi:oligopeptide ABC transporter substrate-binding protein [Peribacillus castrilensis]|uniref:Oligopeptide ABC transporter oligopeptide-binding protein n=1 Tax=Peribacillus simplex TaxID=1478 RepID=A0AAN2PFC8_9BACI|nr:MULTISPECIES: oligopeptide ABC transporter substrate-binding protein [Bacillaceae]MCP1093575.1 oligopeptide ABC transporter substrate-binding protein [Bacillaceae bacterium OS4b]MBD8590981.1 oligopeptide ABC transporter substrate-binding protein [Peribacillus simplex]MCF7621488.1 oligopeptide ABC transporter substrate-binding protein [Peribacillus frigoritolerans]MCP1152144.1 oligopeptide ABC transporter substrate-binding protein [Peribacillus frigoritolerans]MCT1389598.1 oligopeptide ABC t
MKIKSYSKVLSALAISSLLLAACSNDTEKSSTKEKKGKDVEQVDTSKFPTKTTNQGEPIEGGHLTYGLVSDTPFEGILNKVFYQGEPDNQVITFFDEDLLDTDEDYVFTNEGAASYEISDDHKTVTLTIKDNVNWHDGKPVTGADLEYAYLVMGSKDYKGVRYDEQMALIEGMEEYHEGKADKISGIKVDGKKITFTFKKANPSVTTGLWTYPLHKEYLKDVPIADLESSDKIRKNPIGFGPFKVKKIVQGEAVEFEANKDYYRGEPKLDSVTLKVVNPSVVVKSLENGDLDVAEVLAEQYEQAKELDNVELLGKVELAYSYIGFNFGHYDKEKEENVMDENPKFGDKRLRQAMAYAINNKEVGEKMYKGLRFPANSVITPNFKYNNKDVKAYEYNPEKAKELLDEAGFVDTNNDGIREDADGKEFKINFASMSGSDVSEPLARYYIQQWEQVGLDVELQDGRLHEFNSFYDLLKKDNDEVDVYSAAWGVASDPDPSGIWSRSAEFNYTRWVSEKNDELLAKGISEEAFDDQYRIDTYNEWQELIHEEVPVIPTLFRYQLAGVNERVTGYDYLAGRQYQWHNVGVTK